MGNPPLISIVRHMDSDAIAEITIDSAGRLCVTPGSAEFPLIYRAAMEVHWDQKGRFLYSPRPREWSYPQWFHQIVAAARGEYGCALSITPQTRWNNIDANLKEAILAAGTSAHA